MATLADSFLADLEDLSDDENRDEKGAEATEEAPDANKNLAGAAILKYDELDSVAKLQKSQRFHDVVKNTSMIIDYTHSTNEDIACRGSSFQMVVLEA